MIGFGTFFGGLMGYLLGKAFGIGFLGLMLGGWMGFRFDRALRQLLQGIPFQFTHHTGQRSNAQQTFFDVTFAVMGHLAKADGVVTAQEIEIAQSAMRQCRMTHQQKKEARAAFNRGKQPDFQLEQALQQLKHALGGNFILLQLFLDFQRQTAQADGALSSEKQRILETICQYLGIQMHHGGFQHGFHQHFGGGQQRRRASPHQLDEAYRTLGASAQDDDKTLKKKYHKQMGEHHPDRLMAKGLPEEMIKMATEKASKIQSAYDLIRKSRGLK